MADFCMPALGADLDAATLLRWLVARGDHVTRGQIVAEVETDKGVLDVEVFEDGIVAEILVPEGSRVAVGTTLARIESAARSVDAPAAARPAEAKAAAAAPPVEALPPRVDAAPSRARPRRSSPAARVLAETLGIDIETIAGSGPGGAVTVQDVHRAAPAGTPDKPGAAAYPPPLPAAAPPAGAPVAAGSSASPVPRGSRDSAAARESMRASIAALMARSKREIPHYYLAHDIDMEAAMEWLERRNATAPLAERLLPAALMARAVALAAREFPELNGTFANERFVPASSVHLGVAISLKDAGLLAPAILDADRKSLPELMAAMLDLVRRARAGRLRASEMSSPTITVTSLGDQGVSTIFGVIYPPQVALVGFGSIGARPPGMAGARRFVTATLSADHRASDGHRGALFLREIERRLLAPEGL